MHACMHTYIHTYIHAYIHTYIPKGNMEMGPLRFKITRVSEYYNTHNLKFVRTALNGLLIITVDTILMRELHVHPLTVISKLPTEAGGLGVRPVVAADVTPVLRVIHQRRPDALVR